MLSHSIPDIKLPKRLNPQMLELFFAGRDYKIRDLKFEIDECSALLDRTN